MKGLCIILTCHQHVTMDPLAQSGFSTAPPVLLALMTDFLICSGACGSQSFIKEKVWVHLNLIY